MSGVVDINHAVEQAGESLMAIPGVVGVGVTEVDGQPAVLVMVSHLTPEMRKALPETISGYPVKLEVTGEIRGHLAD